MALARHIPPNLLIVSILLFGPPSCTLLPIPLFLFVLPSRFLVFCPFSFFSFVHVSHATVVVIQSVSSASLAYRSFAANLLLSFSLSLPTQTPCIVISCIFLPSPFFFRFLFSLIHSLSHLLPPHHYFPLFLPFRFSTATSSLLPHTLHLSPTFLRPLSSYNYLREQWYQNVFFFTFFYPFLITFGLDGHD